MGRVAEDWGRFASSSHDDEELSLVRQAASPMARADAALAQLAGLLDKGDAERVRPFAAAGRYPAIDPVAEVIDKLAVVQLAGAGAGYRAARWSARA